MGADDDTKAMLLSTFIKMVCITFISYKPLPLPRSLPLVQLSSRARPFRFTNPRLHNQKVNLYPELSDTVKRELKRYANHLNAELQQRAVEVRVALF